MISFEVSAIDIILVIAVFVLLILYMTKLLEKSSEKTSFLSKVTKTKILEKSPEKTLFHSQLTQGEKQERFLSRPQTDYTECPRGFGKIRKLGEDNSVSEKCLGCYEIMECFSENE